MSWTRTDDQATLADFEAVATDPVVPNRVYSGSSKGLMVSNDGGSTWHQPATGPIDMRVLSFAFDPQTPSMLYAGAWQGVFRSDDSGEHWTSSLTDHTIWDIAVDPSSPSTLYVCTYDGVYKSTNGGNSWHPISTGLTADYCWALAVDPSSPQTVYQGSGAGVFRTTDGGSGWGPLAGLEEYGIYDLGFSPNHNTLYAATGGGGVASYSFSGAACSLACSAIVPKNSSVGSEVYFQADAVASGCASSPTFDWDFGDTSSHSGAQKASHTYGSAGAYLWSVTASADGVSCRSTGTVAVDPSPTSWYIPGVAHAQGAGGTVWRTDVAAINRSTSAASVTATFIPYDGDATVARSLALAPNAVMEWDDVLVSLFGMSADASVKGTVELSSTERLIASARTYNQSATGTFGQYLPALPAKPTLALTSSAGADIIRGDELGVIPHLTKSADFRSNVGVQNLGDSAVTVEIRLWDGHGMQLGSPWTATVGVGHYRQLDDVFAVLGGGSPAIAYATVRVTSTDGAAWFYGSVIDNVTGDPTTIPVLRPWEGDREIAGIAHSPGAGGTTWRSDVAAVYLGSQNVDFRPRFTAYGTGGTVEGLASVPAGGTMEWHDIAVSLFGHSPDDAVKGTLGIDSLPGLYLTARTYNQGSNGTFGQYLPAVTAAEGFGRGILAMIPQLKKNTCVPDQRRRAQPEPVRSRGGDQALQRLGRPGGHDAQPVGAGQRVLPGGRRLRGARRGQPRRRLRDRRGHDRRRPHLGLRLGDRQRDGRPDHHPRPGAVAPRVALTPGPLALDGPSSPGQCSTSCFHSLREWGIRSRRKADFQGRFARHGKESAPRTAAGHFVIKPDAHSASKAFHLQGPLRERRGP